MPRYRIPVDIARVLEDHRTLGKAIRRALYVSERVTRKEVEEAIRHAQALRKAVDDSGRPPPDVPLSVR